MGCLFLPKEENYNDMIARLYPELHTKTGQLSKEVTFQVTDACNLACSYCYQINKSHRVMKFEYAKKLIDQLLTEDLKLNNYLTLEQSPALILEFIGGEPLLEIELIDQICDYFLDRAIALQHPWAVRHVFGITSNGILYFDPKVQRFFDKHPNEVSLSITLDGNKKLHDSCRRFPNGDPSYDLALAAIEDWTKNKQRYMGSKITISPDNLLFLNEAIIHMVNLDYKNIFANTVFEKGWSQNDAILFYQQLKEIADFFIDNELYKTTYLSLFEEQFFRPQDPISENGNWCGGNGQMLAMDPDGYLYPCLRYMESSLGSSVEPYRIGHIDSGIANTQEEQQKLKCLNCLTRRSQSTDECFNCPISAGCAWCSGYNYQETGTPNKRVTYICEMHKARALANVYYWNKIYRKEKESKRLKLYCPKEWALKIISEEEYNFLYKISKED